MNLLGQIQAELAEQSEAVTSDLVSLINSRIRPPVPVTTDSVHIRTMFVISDQVNSYGGRLPLEEHPNVARLLVDSPVLIGHAKDKLPVGRNFKAELVEKNGQRWIKVWFYWLKGTAEAESLVQNIDHGIYKECSIGFFFDFPECSVCGQDIRTCEHVPLSTCQGTDGSEQKVFFNYRGVRKVLETSLVYRGAVPETALSNELFVKPGKNSTSRVDPASGGVGKTAPAQKNPNGRFELRRMEHSKKSKTLLLLLLEGDLQAFALENFDVSRLAAGKRFRCTPVDSAKINGEKNSFALLDSGACEVIGKDELVLSGKVLRGQVSLASAPSRGTFLTSSGNRGSTTSPNAVQSGIRGASPKQVGVQRVEPTQTKFQSHAR